MKPVQDHSSAKNVFNAETPAYDIAQIMGGIYGDGIIGLKNAFSREWTSQLHEDILAAYEDALKRPGGAVGRGPKRHYVEFIPKTLEDLLTWPRIHGW